MCWVQRTGFLVLTTFLLSGCAKNPSYLYEPGEKPIPPGIENQIHPKITTQIRSTPISPLKMTYWPYLVIQLPASNRKQKRGTFTLGHIPIWICRAPTWSKANRSPSHLMTKVLSSSVSPVARSNQERKGHPSHPQQISHLSRVRLFFLTLGCVRFFERNDGRIPLELGQRGEGRKSMEGSARSLGFCRI